MTPADVSSLTRYVSDFSRRRVLVLGDAILDEYLLGDCSRISPEAPVPVLKVHSHKQALGGAANTAANIMSLGGQASLIALVGTDETGLTLRDRATETGIDLRVIDHGAATLRKTRVIGQHQQIVRLDYEEMSHANRQLATQILDQFEAVIGQSDIVVISDYAKGFLSLALSREIIDRAHQAGRQVLIDPRPQHRDFYDGCDYLTPNWKESRALLHLTDTEPASDDTAAIASRLAAALHTNVVLTLGAQGIRFCSKTGNEQFAVPTIAREVFDVSGAGDTVAAAFALAIAAGADHATAVAIANRAASVVVSKFGTATVRPDEMLDDANGSRLVAQDQLAPLEATLRDKRKRIVAVVGHFEPFHHGHVQLLNEARKSGDVLIVGLTSVAPAKSGGSAGTEPHRAEMLLSLRSVDYVHILDNQDPTAFLNAVRPDVQISAEKAEADPLALP